MIAAGVLARLGIDELAWLDAVNAATERYAIVTPDRTAFWLAQCAHESSGFTSLRENLNYSAEGLMATFGSRRFDPPSARAYARQPERIANHVYASRLGNGDESSGDGWRYRGGGLLGLTFRDNYAACSASIGVDLVAQPERITEPEIAALSAAWFWDSKALNGVADVGAFAEVTRRINGGYAGLEQREGWLRRVRTAMGGAT